MQVGIDRNALMLGLAEASSNYEATLSDDRCLLDVSMGPYDEERETWQAANPDIIIPNVLGLTEDEAVIAASSEFKAEQKKGYTEAQYIFNVAVGEAVARELSLVTSSPEAIALLPHRAVAVVEVNANRLFRRGQEDPLGCYGLRQGHLGHVVIDAYYAGSEALTASEEERIHIDYMSELGSFPNPGEELPRNAARVLIRPAYPLVPERIDRMSPRDIFLARLDPSKASERDMREVGSDYAVLRGEYRICRAVSIGHDLSDWQPEDFESFEEAIDRGARV